MYQVVHDSLSLVVVDDVGDDDEGNADGHHAEAGAENLRLVVVLKREFAWCGSGTGFGSGGRPAEMRPVGLEFESHSDKTFFFPLK